MKKNWTMKVAALMLALTMITACFVGSTFAKYVTRAQGEDNARVAKWGVLVNLKGNAFSTQYKTHDTNGYEGEFSVVSSNEDQVVAPGTSSDDLDQTLVGSVTGTPEVAARYAITGTVTDIVLPADTYTDYTELVENPDYDPDDPDSQQYGYFKTFTLEKDYSPVKWNLVISGKGQEINVADALYANLPPENYGLTPTGCSFFDAVKILKKVASNDTYVQIVENALGQIVSDGSNFQLDVTDDGEFTLSYDFDPNKEMDYTFELSWEWAFENGEEIMETIENDDGTTTEVPTGIYEFDAADTFLGNWAAVILGQDIEGFKAPTKDGASIYIGATLVATATQID